MKRYIKAAKDYEQYGLDEDVETTLQDIFEQTLEEIAQDEFHYDIKKVGQDYIINHKGYEVELKYLDWYPKIESKFDRRKYVGDAGFEAQRIIGDACVDLHDTVYEDDYLDYRDEY